MASPIQATPPLRGKQAKKFLKDVKANQGKPIAPEAVKLNRQKIIEALAKNA